MFLRTRRHRSVSRSPSSLASRKQRLRLPARTRRSKPAFRTSNTVHLEPLPEVHPSDAAAILYTSGTTARPKGVTHTHSSLVHVARLMLSMIGEAGPVSMVSTQMAHASGLGCLLLPSILDGKASVL